MGGGVGMEVRRTFCSCDGGIEGAIVVEEFGNFEGHEWQDFFCGNVELMCAFVSSNNDVGIW